MIPHANRSIYHTVAMSGMLGLILGASPAAAQLPPWQQPPNAESTVRPDSNASDRPASTTDVPDNAPAPWAAKDYEQDGGPMGFGRGFLPNLACELVHDRVWARSEFLGWWTKGFAVPPLLTTSPIGTDPTQAGVLGLASTSILFGQTDQGGGFHPGDRITLGTWLSDRQSLGLEASYLHIDRKTDFFNTSSVSVPILARPFYNSEIGVQDSQLIAYPGQQSGTFSSAVSSDLQVAEVLVRKNLSRQSQFVVDLVSGYRYQQLEDHLAAGDSLTISGTQSGFPTGTTLQQSDRFDTRNVFQGGEVGMSATVHLQAWTIDTLLKIAAGQTRSRVTIDGSTVTAIPGQAATVAPGGLLALPSNVGVYDSSQFSVVPELGVTLGYDLSPHVRATVGYDLVYWNNVARPGDQIDLNLDPRQFPPSAVTNAAQPAFHLHTSDYWAQGLNLGLDFRF